MNIFLEGLTISDLKQIISQTVENALISNEKTEVNKPTYYSRHEVAKLLGVHVNTIDNLRRSGQLNFSRIGRTLRISQEEVQNLLDNQKNAI